MCCIMREHVTAYLQCPHCNSVCRPQRAQQCASTVRWMIKWWRRDNLYTICFIALLCFRFRGVLHWPCFVTENNWWSGLREMRDICFPRYKYISLQFWMITSSSIIGSISLILIEMSPSDYAQYSCRCCTGQPPVLHRTAACVAQDSCRCCTGQLPVLHRTAAGVAQDSCRCCTGQLPVLHWTAAGVALDSCLCCTG